MNLTKLRIKKLHKLENIISIFMLIYFLGGIFFHQVFLESALFLTEIGLLIWNFIILLFIFKGFSQNRERRNKLIFWFLFSYLLTLILEILGVATGLVFGDYEYGEVFRMKIFNTPYIIGLNWVMVISGAIVISEKLFKWLKIWSKKSNLISSKFWNSGILNLIFISILTGIIATIFDYFLEPIAIQFDYWSWDLGFVPIHNYIAWFVISASFATFFKILKLEFKNHIAAYYFLAQLGFFIGLNIINLF